MPNWDRLLLRILVVLAALENPASADDVIFSQGSLIIPMQSNFQDACGVTSAYGLVWQILLANQPGHYFANANRIVTVYVIANPNKTSPNRCVPSNRTAAPAPSNPGPSGDPNHWDDPQWNDGCDMAVSSRWQQPVVPVDFNASPPWPASGIYPYGDVPWTDTSALTITGVGWGNSWDFASPKLQAATLNNVVANPRFATVQYMGGPFVIDSADAPLVMQFLRSGDAYTPATYLARFTALVDPVSGLSNCPNGGTTPSPDYHHVNVHQATEQFTAPVSRRLNGIPPKIALLDTGAGVKWYGTEQGGIRVLDMYLKNANLFFPGSVGCPAGSFAGCTLNNGNPGLIYDQFNAYADLISTGANPYGLLNAVDGFGRPIYRLFWAPHWEANRMNPWVGTSWDMGSDLTPNFSQYVANGDGATTQQENAYNNVAYFANQRYHGLMAECSSLGGYEGDSASPVSNRTQFLFTNAITTNGFNVPSTGFDGRNCSDPNYASGDCVLFDQSASNLFAQIGDYHFVALSGAIGNFAPNQTASPPSTYRSGVSRLAVSWANYTGPPTLSNYRATGRTGWDFFDFGYKDNDDRKAAIVYIAGHEYTNSAAGNRIVLNTLLHLGYNPIGNERSLSHPVAYTDPNGATDAQRAWVLAASYEAINGLAPDANPYDYRYSSKWRFPLIRGHLRAHSLLGANQLASGESDFGAATLWDADGMMPLPRSRNLFTYLGGYIKASPTPADLGGPGRAAANDVIQLAWTPTNVAGTAIGAGCVDVLQLGVTPDGSCGLIPGSDGICDLQEAIQYTRLDLGNDCGVSEARANSSLLATPANLNPTQQMLQLVRGYCAATATRLDGSTPILEPDDTQCNDFEGVQLNRAHLGGVAHSSPAVVPPSKNIDDGAVPRPTVAYVAALDGQIHAIYVSGGIGYNPPTGRLTFLNRPANAAFINDWSQAPGGFQPPAAGTELWSFLPASQLPWLHANQAQVDSSPVVEDAFIDLVGQGIREWHTVLVASVGGLNREIFALDISNPLKPVLLWDLVGSLRRDGEYPYYSPAALTNAAVPLGASQAPHWRERDSSFRGSCVATDGCDLTRVYDFTGLGGSLGLAIGEFRKGLLPMTALFLASNSSGVNGIPAGLEVFAVDVATGQKLWEWVEPYGAVTNFADNTVPPPVSLMRNATGAARIYAGDMEGNLWELDATTGMNANVFFDGTGCASGCKFVALSTQSTATFQEPITTNLALARIPSLPPSSPSVFAPFANSNVVIFGTAGANWVSFNNPGQLHVAFLDDRYRKPYRVSGSATDSVNQVTQSQQQWIDAAAATGVLLERAPTFPLTFTGSHLYGTITISGQSAFFETARDRIPQDINWLQGSIQGGTYQIDLGTVTNTVNGDAMVSGFGSLASYGGVTVYHDTSTGTPTDYVLTAEVSKLAKTSMGSSSAAARNSLLDPNSNGSGVFYIIKGLLQRFDSGQ